MNIKIKDFSFGIDFKINDNLDFGISSERGNYSSKIYI